MRGLAESSRIALLAVILLLSATPARGDHVSEGDIVEVLPRDAIPAILNPRFGGDPSWLHPESRVIGLDIAGDARAYPIAILNWHEIVNDVVGGEPIAITFCPLCGTGIVFERTVGDRILTFGVSGRLYKNDLVMYDHQTESYWTQVLGEAIRGAFHGTRLVALTGTTLSWSEWLDSHPDTKLLDRPVDDRGQFLRDYAYDPYAGYASSPEIWFPRGNVDPYRVLDPKALVLGVVLGGRARAYPESTLREEGAVNDVLGDVPVLVTNVDGAMKAWERGERTFRPGTDRMVVDDLGNAFDAISGRGESGQLTEIHAITAFWFAWYDFYPATSIYGFDDLQPAPDPASAVFAWSIAAAAGTAAVAAAVAVRRLRRKARRG